MKDERTRALERAAASGDAEAAVELDRRRARTAAKKVRPLLVAMSASGDEVVHLVKSHRKALCERPALGFTYTWQGWAGEEGEPLIAAHCEDCHRQVKALKQKAFEKVIAAQIAVSRDHGVRVPKPEELGFRYRYKQATSMTDEERARLNGRIAELAEEIGQQPPLELSHEEAVAHFQQHGFCREAQARGGHVGHPCKLCGQRVMRADEEPQS